MLEKLSQEIPQIIGPDCKEVRLSFKGTPYEELTVMTYPAGLVRVLTLLRDHPSCAFQQLIDIAGVDHLERAPRFDVVYHLLSVTNNQRLRVVVSVDEEVSIPSVAQVYPCAVWCEREIWDMYGVGFDSHPDLRRILTDYNFDGHPFRKDFPLSGYVEVRYDTELRRVVYAPLELQQQFRDFDFLSPWEGMLPGDEKAAS